MWVIDWRKREVLVNRLGVIMIFLCCSEVEGFVLIDKEFSGEVVADDPPFARG